MSTHAPLETSGAPLYERSTRSKRNKRYFFLFAMVWLMLIMIGIAGAKLYSDHIQRQVAADLEQQTAEQIAAMQKQYDERLAKLETSYKEELSSLEGKVDALNELLTFTKDNADVKTDNSNKLYSQLNEVKKKLNELQKSLDVLK
ncbi:hypothetical protein [Paenibacillus sp. NEAU-GSW1]|uniref:hypothetical protein n=1 Tax=Paenibacillus sp. NEAU-GSW1 TaxID=2682486 RepID=UPI0012E105A8|nr:hypothetical protein [Paenibacillus sp. NEAU-GSW1]MUT65607.1 hypothetical protein [Paenibacillus sp. NEAU-GSW1]